MQENEVLQRCAELHNTLQTRVGRVDSQLPDPEDGGSSSSDVDIGDWADNSLYNGPDTCGESGSPEIDVRDAVPDSSRDQGSNPDEGAIALMLNFSLNNSNTSNIHAFDTTGQTATHVDIRFVN